MPTKQTKSQKQATNKAAESKQAKALKTGWEELSDRFNQITTTYANIPYDVMARAFTNANMQMANEPHIQNSRVKAISSLPADYTKEEIGEFLRRVYESEVPLRQTAETLAWTAYPFFKIIKTYADIPTYHHYVKPLYLDNETAKTEEFKREATLLDKFNRELMPEKICHTIVGKAMKQGKVFYAPRYEVDKAHNTVNHAFLQQLPEDWCMIIGENNISRWTISFNLMYFLNPGTSTAAYGDLFKPFLDDFNEMFIEKKTVDSRRYVYGSKDSGYSEPVKCKGGTIDFYPGNLKPNAEGDPQVFMQNGRWMYYVSLPIDKVWTFEIDDTTPAVASPLAGLFLTYAQEADYEATQLSLLMNPLIKIFTAETPYFTDNGATQADGFRMSPGMRTLFEQWFDDLMTAHNTAGTALFSMPATNIKSHDFAESANANDISSSFNRYAGTKAGLAALIPVDEDIKGGQVEASKLLESRYATATIYPQFERMMNIIYEKLNLKYSWEFVMFGTIFTDEMIRENAYKAIANGDISAHFVLSAMDGGSWLDKLSSMRAIKESGMLDMLIPPVTSYTMKQETNGGLPPQSTEGGRPKETSSDLSDAKEKAVDAGTREL